jgi:membrane-anchored mycosin MYCP
VRVTRPVTTGALAPAVAALVAASVLVPAGPAHAETVDCTSTQADAPAPSSSTDPSLPLDLLGIARAHTWLDAQRTKPGAGVRVAVVDSGVAPRAAGTAIPVVGDRPPRISKKQEVVEAHGTIVAGIIAGSPRGDDGTDGSGTDGSGDGAAEDAERLVGVAPAAEIVDVRVYDSAGGAEDEDPVQPTNLVAGLEWVAANAERLGIGVVNVSLAIGEYPPLTRVLERLDAADVVVVAASGNRPEQETDPLYAEFGPDPDAGEDEGSTGPKPGEDAAGLVWPAAYDEVVGVSATADGTDAGDATEQVLQSSDIDVAVPTHGLISYGLDGGSCGVSGFYTSWAAAVVSGVVAMLRSAYPDETAGQVVTRLLATASASDELPNVQTGAGVVQPYEALTRQLSPKRDRSLETAPPEPHSVERATAPPQEVDLLSGARDRAVWWGLVGGGALLLALVLRPALARRRP